MATSLRARATALGAAPTVCERGDRTLTAVYRVGDAEPVLEGHFPGLPVFPGVCLVECAEWACREALAGFDLAPRLAAVESVRFVRPVFPGDEVRVHVVVKQPQPDTWVCSIRLTTGAEPAPLDAARVRLRFQAGQVPG